MKENIIVIRPQSVWKLVDLDELWRFRELFFIFAWRNIKIRYKQTALGILWVVFQPLVTTLIFTQFFGKLAKIPSGNLPYSLFVLCGLVFWTFFSSTLTHASASMVTNNSLIQKIYFPKIILPLSSVITYFIDLLINLFFLFGYAFILGYFPNIWAIIIFPLAILVTSFTAVGLSFFLASINVKYRDVNYILPFFIQILLFVTPIIYPLSIVSDTNKHIMAVNPMASVMESVRMAFSAQPSLNPTLIAISVSTSLVIFLFGLWYFNKTERYFADIV